MKKRLLPIAIISIITSLILTSCADMFQGKIDINTTSTLSSLGDILQEPVKISELETPAQLFVSDGDSSGTIRVSWSSVEGAQSYRLERAVVTSKNERGVYEEPSEADFSPVPTSVGSTAHIYNRTSFDDVIINDPTYRNPEYGYKYYYRICAENESRGYGSSEYTDMVSGSLFAPPSGVTASAGSFKDRIELKWNPSASDSTVSYIIYRSMYSDGSNANAIATVKANMRTYTFPVSEADRGIEYYFFVRAQNSARQQSVDSSIALGYAQADGAPAQVTEVNVTRAMESVTVRWTGDADTSYALYRSSSKDSALTLVTNGLTGKTDYVVDTEDSSSLEYSTYYYYMVQPSKTAEDGTLVKGPLSDTGPSSENPAEAYLISPPETVTVTKGAQGHQISWSPAIGNDEEKNSFSYIIMGSESSSGGFTDLQTVQVSSLSLSNGLYYLDITEPKKYYRIRTEKDGQNSPPSDVQAPAPYAPRSITVTAYANLSSEMGSSWSPNGNEVYPVKITWQGPEDSSDVAGYYVFRSDKRDRGFKKLSVNNDEKTFVITGNTFYDTNPTARPKQVYYYKVLSLNSLYGGANYSDTEKGYGALTANQYMREYNLTSASSHKHLTLMHKSGNTAKLGQETGYGSVSGTIDYDAHVSGVSGRVIMTYTNYADFYIHNDGKMNSTPLGPDEDEVGTEHGIYFLFVEGNTNTSAGMDTNGTMDGTVTCRGMYPGSVNYNNIQIKGGAAGGGYYVVTRQGFAPENVHWSVAEE
ncbi:MAG: fibronectin type III domain-containing protein [Treponema sp.]|nr:fibronectin type III domain-containing protein [Treponema sp.]